MISHFTSISIPLISDVSQEMILSSNGIDYFAGYMVDVAVPLTSIKQIPKRVCIRMRRVQRKD
jgi:hypothetical protein